MGKLNENTDLFWLGHERLKSKHNKSEKCAWLVMAMKIYERI